MHGRKVSRGPSGAPDKIAVAIEIALTVFGIDWSSKVHYASGPNAQLPKMLSARMMQASGLT
jgi:hypothetical protein